jgi:hypothetical protein
MLKKKQNKTNKRTKKCVSMQPCKLSGKIQTVFKKILEKFKYITHANIIAYIEIIFVWEDEHLILFHLEFCTTNISKKPYFLSLQ